MFTVFLAGMLFGLLVVASVWALQLYIERSEKPEQPTVDEKIIATWGTENDFETMGIPFVCWVISQDLEEIKRENWNEDEAVEEFADIIINSRRFLIENGYDPDTVIRDRLENHAEKSVGELTTEAIKEYEEQVDSDTWLF